MISYKAHILRICTCKYRNDLPTPVIEYFAQGLTLESTIVPECGAVFKFPTMNINLVNNTHYAGKSE